jgi:hypothetical protein
MHRAGRIKREKEPLEELGTPLGLIAEERERVLVHADVDRCRVAVLQTYWND